MYIYFTLFAEFNINIITLRKTAILTQRKMADPQQQNGEQQNGAANGAAAAPAAEVKQEPQGLSLNI